MQSKPEVIIGGSAAAEGIPAFFCNCGVCENARNKGGREIRYRTTYRFGEEILVDFGPDVFHSQARHYGNLDTVKFVLVTHAHQDHFYPEQAAFHFPAFSNVAPDAFLTVVGSEPTRKLLYGNADSPPAQLADWQMRFMGIEPLKPLALPGIDATVVALPANHAPELKPVVYIVTLRGRTVLFCNDTGYLPEESWRFIESHRMRLDAAILDCTGCGKNWRDGHMGGETIMETLKRLEAAGYVDADTTKVVNHFSHNGGMSHEQLCHFFEPHGIAVGFDGMRC